MKAILLGAGRGSRLKNSNKLLPKAFIKYHGIPLIESHLTNLRKIEIIDEVVVISGFKNELFKYLDATHLINENWAETNIVGSLYKANEFLTKYECLVIYCDIYLETTALMNFISTNSPAILNVSNFREIWKSRFENPLTDLERFELDCDGRLKKIGGRANCFSEIQGQFGGVFLLNPSTWEVALRLKEDIQQYDSTKLISELIENGINFNVYNYKGIWKEFDIPSDIG
jgi:choline kinase